MLWIFEMFPLCSCLQDQSFLTKVWWVFICTKVMMWRYMIVWLIAVSHFLMYQRILISFLVKHKNYCVAGNFGKVFRFGNFGKDHQIKILPIYSIALPDLNFSKLYQLSVNLMLTKVTRCVVCI